MPTVSVTGSAGFLGRHLLALLGARENLQLRLLVHHRPPVQPPGRRAQLVPGDVLRPETLRELGRPGGTVIHLAQPRGGERENRQATENIIAACAAAGIRRMIHCSTAVVVGRSAPARVDEKTPCRPRTPYERAKLAAEDLLRANGSPQFECVILRPTAVFGPGGRNLMKLCEELRRGPRLATELRSCLHGRRRMNLVNVATVVAAIAFLIEAPLIQAGEVFIVSEDDEAANNYRDVETVLRRCFGLTEPRVPRVSLPPAALRAALWLAGRSNTNPSRTYDGSKLAAAGFQKPFSFETGLAAFGEWYHLERWSGAAR